ncbi:uncharacterized protein LOC114841391 [Diachasma alloeum]|uniref:Odorant receptor n=1 Tax=Diachasma alloeum TaxID=454923 RepID=A0A4E0RZ27_9HYME|nr:uncharacterized protein LOC114841391 [Diachasma alloeum]THK33121.1 odorant receptor 70 [Diachasma alloeum]
MIKRNIEDLWHIDARRNFRIYKVAAQIMGVWPFTCQEKFSKIRFFSLIIILISMAAMLAHDMLSNCGNIDTTLESIVFVLSALLGIVKITLPRIYWRNIESIIVSAAYDWSTTINPKSRKIMEKTSLIGTAAFILLLGGSLFISVLFVLHKVMLNFRMSSRNLTTQYVVFGAGCWRSNLPISINSIYAVQTIQLGTMQLCVSGNDACYYQIISYLSGQLDILNLNVEELSHSYDRKTSPIDEFIRRHNCLLRLCWHVEDTYNFVVMCHLMNNLCFTMMIVLTTWNENKGLGYLVIFGSITIFLYGQIFLYSLGGDVIKTKTESLFHYIYSCPWYQLPTSERRKVLLILTKTNYPIHFTAGNFYRLNLENFKNIVKFTVTLFSFLRLSLQE